MNRPLTIKAAAKALGFTEYSLRKAAKDGSIPCLKIGGRYLFYMDQVIDLLRAKAQSNIRKNGGE